MCFHASTHSRTDIGSMNIIMWPVGHKRSESSRGAKGLAASFDVRSRRNGHRFMDAFIWISESCWQGKHWLKHVSEGQGPDSECADECDCDCSHVLCDWKKGPQKIDKGRARGKSDSLCLYRTIIRWEGVNVSHSDQNPLRIKSTSPCLHAH